MLTEIIQFVIGVGLTGLMFLSMALLYRGHFTKPRVPTKGEQYYYTTSKDRFTTSNGVSSIKDPCELTLTVVVPAYNETERLPIMIEDAAEYLKDENQRDPDFKYEIIIVDDGSKDNTSETALRSAEQYGIKEHLKVIKLELNRGKGGAVTQGTLAARGKYILFADADGATKFSDIEHLVKKMDQVIDQGQGVVIGSRTHLEGTGAVVKRTALRSFLMMGFHTYLNILGIRGIRDTQCGFKLFSRKSAHIIFTNLHTERWIFDIEALLLAKLFKMPIAEVNVNWHEVAGSKINIIRDAIRMALDLLMIRLCYSAGVWKVTNPLTSKVK